MSARTSPVTWRGEFGLQPDGDAPVVPVRVRLTYDPSDPFAVHAAFRTGPDTEIGWVFARELLAAGLTGPAGIGDVRVRPVPADADAAGRRARHLVLELSSPSGRARFRADADVVGEFLLATYAAVPPGCEADLLGLDVELGALLIEEGEWW